MLRISTLKVLIAVSIMIALVSCSQVPEIEETATPMVEDTETAPPEETLLVAVAHSGPVSDSGWSYSHDVGRLAIEDAFTNVTTKFIESLTWGAETSQVLEAFIADGARMIIVTGDYEDFVSTTAAQHPDVVFLQCDANVLSDNLIAYYVQHEFPSYLIGMAAGLLTETNKLGFIGTFTTPSNYASVNSFTLGAQSVNPNVTTNVVLINEWFDPVAARQAAEALISEGVDVLFGITDEPSYLQVAEAQGVWAATWNTDMRRFGPNAYISSMMLDWAPFYVSEVEALLNGTWEGNRKVLLPLGAGTDRDEWGEHVPQEIRDQVDEVRNRMLNDNYNPFMGPIYDSNGNLRIPEGEVLSPEYSNVEWTWSVQGVIGMPEYEGW